jgi:uncharacterized protein (DUF2062 family)
MYMAGTLLGCALLGVPSEGLHSIRWDLSGEAFYASLWHGLAPFLLPYVVGNLILGLLAAAVAYVALRSALPRRGQPGHA